MNILNFIIFILNIYEVFCQSSDLDLFKSYLIEVYGDIATKAVEQYQCNVGNDVECDNGAITKLTINIGGGDTQVHKMSKFPTLSKLNRLEIYNIRIEGDEFPTNLFSFPELTEIKIMNTPIKIPTTIPENNKITVLELNNNTLTEFPYQLKSLNNLKTLKINNNVIKSELTDELNQFTNLENMNIDNNLLSGILHISENMKEVIASNNKLTSVVRNCSNCNLEKLDMTNNTLREVKPDFLKGLDKLENLNFSNNKQLEIEIINFKKGNQNILNCNFENTKISCLQKTTCYNVISDNMNIDECPADLIKKYINMEQNSNSNSNGNNDQKNSQSNKVVPILSVIVVILLAITGFMWMYKTNQQRKKSREADIIISPTVKNENYYKELLNNENKEENNYQNKSFDNFNNKQNSVDNSFANNSSTNINEPISPVSRILPESLTSITSSNSYSNQDPNDSSINNSIIRSKTHVDYNTTMVNPMMRSSTLPASKNINRNPMMHSATVPTTTPITISDTAQTNQVSPMNNQEIIGNTSMEMPNFMINQTVGNTSMEMSSSMINSAISAPVQNVTNTMLQGNGINPLQVPSAAYINSNFSNGIINGVNNINVQPSLAIYQMNINDMNNYSNFASSSSNNNNNNNNNNKYYFNPNPNGKDPQDLDDIKLKKKILQEKMNLEKFNINQNNNQDDHDNNLPPYSEL